MKNIFQLITTLLICLMSGACVREVQNRPISERQGPPVAEASFNNGGVDSSGGNLSRSKKDDFDLALKRSLHNVASAYHRLSSIYFSREYIYDDDELTHEAHQLQGVMIMNKIVDERTREYRNVLTEHLAAVLKAENRSEVQEKIKNIKISLLDKDCSSNEGHRDASANPLGEVCVNFQSALRIPPEQLELHLTALLAHEAAHVLKLNEFEAQSIQDALISFPSVALADAPIIKTLERAYERQINAYSVWAKNLKNWLQKPSTENFNFYCQPFEQKFDQDKLFYLSAMQEAEDYSENKNDRLLLTDVFRETQSLWEGPHALAFEKMNIFCYENKDSIKTHQIPQLKVLMKAAAIEFEINGAQLAKIYQKFKKQVHFHPEAVHLPKP